jgi:ABC-type branched-subunit amino acid transport system ATPase component
MTTPAAAAFPALSVSDLEVRYGTAVAVSSLTLRADKGAVVALLGVNGSGKSSFARRAPGWYRQLRVASSSGSRT